MYAVNITSPAQLSLVSGCQNSGEAGLKFEMWGGHGDQNSENTLQIYKGVKKK